MDTVRNFSNQVFGKHGNCMIEAFLWCTKTPFKPLLIDCHPRCDSSLQIRSNLFGPGPMEVFLPKNEKNY